MPGVLSCGYMYRRGVWRTRIRNLAHTLSLTCQSTVVDCCRLQCNFDRQFLKYLILQLTNGAFVFCQCVVEGDLFRIQAKSIITFHCGLKIFRHLDQLFNHLRRLNSPVVIFNQLQFRGNGPETG